MPCDCNESEKNDINVEIVDASGNTYVGILYAGLEDFMNWFTSKSATFHVEVHSRVVTGDSSVYSAYSLPMIGVTQKSKDEPEKTVDIVINLEKNKSFLILTDTEQRYELGY
tara:strand:- start:22685 stop:23020 length:336 start_codon:yes stop_codon:yes gene_type:complete